MVNWCFRLGFRVSRGLSDYYKATDCNTLVAPWRLFRPLLALLVAVVAVLIVLACLQSAQGRGPQGCLRRDVGKRPSRMAD